MSHQDDVAALIATCLDRMESEGRQALDAVCDEHPQHAGHIREVVSALERQGLLQVAGVTEDSFPAEIGRYCLLRRLGGGGMGVVFLAEDAQLGRRAAVKLIRPDYLFVEGATERLMREVEASARLEHPDIVTVFETGEHAGAPFYAMEYVDGCSLAELVEAVAGQNPAELRGSDMLAEVQRVHGSGPADESHSDAVRLFDGTWTQTSLKIVRRVALAAQHAHHRGILHRDIKPSNVMLTPTGRIVLVDFGLAQVEGGEKLTRTGSALGSLAYMAPEQLDGAAVDARTDVYALGVLLYELLTLRAPFVGNTAADLHRAIVAGSCTAPRAHNGAVPRDAETACLVAFDRDAERRYASAGAFAEDLTRVLEMRPIQARRPGMLVTLGRWVQRNRAASLAAALILGAIAISWAVVDRSTARAGARVREAEGHLDSSLEVALARVDGLLELARDPKVEHSPATSEVRRRLISDGIEAFRSFAAIRPLEPRHRLAMLRGYASFAELLVGLGRGEELDRALREGLILAETYEQPSVEVLAAHARIINIEVRRAFGLRSEDAKARTLERLALVTSWSRAHPESIGLRRVEGELCHHGARAHHLLRERDERDALMRRSIEIARDVLRRYEVPRSRRELCRSLDGLGAYLKRDGKKAEAMRVFADSVSIARSSAEAPEAFYGDQLALAAGLYMLATVFPSRGEGRESLEESLAILESIRERYGEFHRLRLHIANAMHNLAQIDAAEGRGEEAQAKVNRAIELRLAVLDQTPDDRQQRWELGSHWSLWARLQLMQGIHRGLDERLDAIAECKPKQWMAHYSASWVRALRLIVLADDASVSGEERELLKVRAEGQLFDELEAAVVDGMKDPKVLAHPSFEPVRDHERFQALRETLAGN